MQWTKEEKLLLKKLYFVKSPDALCRIFNRKWHTIQRAACRFGIVKKHKKKWIEGELKLFKKLYPTTPNKKLAKQFGISEKAIKTFASRKDLKKDEDYHRNWTPDEEKRLIALWNRGFKTYEIAKKLGKTHPQIYHARKRLKLEGLAKSDVIGRKGESLAEEFFLKEGWKIIERGNRSSAFDFVVERQGIRFPINVKHGNNINITKQNFKRLLKLKHPAILYVLSESEIYLMPILKQ